MPSSRKSTPRRGRSSSVASNVSTTSAKRETSSTPRRSKVSAAAAAVKEAAEAVVPELSRPALPTEPNPALPDAAVPVKLQVIRRDGKNIIIGRVKLPTVGGTDHAFLLKRFDTDAIAASSMFRLAFPYADGEAERGEMAYLERKFDADLANGGRRKAGRKGKGRPKKNSEANKEEGELPEGSSGVKLQGTWIPCSDALEIASEYGLLRFAQPLIEAKATQALNGHPVLTPSKTDKVSTPTSTSTKAKQSREEADSTPSKASRSTKRVREESKGEESGYKKTVEAVGAMTSAQIQAQIKEAQQLVKGIQSNGEATTSSSSSSRKRRAVNQTPTAVLDHLADEEYETSNAVVRSLRKGGRAVRRRPVITTAGALSAVGAGTLAYISGGNLDVATNILQQGVASLQSWFF